MASSGDPKGDFQQQKSKWRFSRPLTMDPGSSTHKLPQRKDSRGHRRPQTLQVEGQEALVGPAQAEHMDATKQHYGKDANHCSRFLLFPRTSFTSIVTHRGLQLASDREALGLLQELLGSWTVKPRSRAELNIH